MNRQQTPPIDGLVVSGVTELALGALTGWPMPVAVSRPEDLKRFGIRSGARLRQWHLDLIMLGSLTAAASRFVANPPRKVAVPLAVGAWVKRQRFRRARLPARPQGTRRLSNRSRSLVHLRVVGLAGLAAVAWKRWLGER